MSSPLSSPKRIAALVGSVLVLASFVFAGTATAACVGSTCTLGGQLRAQVSYDAPLPISLAPTAPWRHDLRWGQPGLVEATPSATIQQQDPAPPGTPSTAPCSLRIVKPGVFTYDGPLVSIGWVKHRLYTFAIQTNLEVTNPHPGTTKSGATAPSGPFATITLEAGGRTGPSVVSWCAGLPAPTASYNPGCNAPDSFGFYTTTTGGLFTNQPASNGLVRYTATKNQFGGANASRVLGTVMHFFNAGGVPVKDLPCTTATNPLCLIAITTYAPGGAGRRLPNGGVWGAKATVVSFLAGPTWLFTGSVGASGTINAVGAGITSDGGSPIPQPTPETNTSWGFPGTTGKLTISVTRPSQISTVTWDTFVRTGGDNRTAGGSGVVVLVSGALSARSFWGPTGNRGWATYNVPEPSALAAAGAGLFALLVCHEWMRHRKR
jgi:hypothetical protein